MNYSGAVDTFTAIVGELPVKSIEKNHIRIYREGLPKLHKRKGKGLLAPGTITKYRENISTLLQFACDEGYIDSNPAAGMRAVAVTKSFAATKARGRSSFAPAEIAAILAAAEAAAVGPHETDTLWYVRLLIYTGARPGEIAQLCPTDVRLDVPTPYIDITDAPTPAGAARSVKNAPSVRCIPIHKWLLEKGFAKFVQAAAAAKSPWLFASLADASTAQAQTRMPARATHIIRGPHPTGAAIISSRKTPHSFRHTFADAIRLTGAAGEVEDDILGHINPKREVAIGYGSAQLVILDNWLQQTDPIDPRRNT